MARGGGMEEVELLDGAADPEPPDTSSPPRRLGWWLAGGAAVVALALAGTQWVVDSRERAAVAALAAVEGVMPPIGDELTVVRTMSQTEAASLWSGFRTDGALVSLVVGEDGSQAFTSIDQRTGEVRWSVPLLGPNAERAQSPEASFGGACESEGGEGQPAPIAACLVTDGFVRYSEADSEEQVPPTTTRVMVLDTADGRVLTEWVAQDDARIALLPGLLMVGHRDTDGSIEIVAHDPRTGAERWRFDEPGAPAETYWSFFRAGDVVAFSRGDTFSLISPTGAIVREDLGTVGPDGSFGTDPRTGDLLITTYGLAGEPLRTTMVDRAGDAAGDRELDGGLVDLTVDDGSLPGIVLTTFGELHAWDRETGEERWTSDVKPGYGAVVARGRVYLSTASTLVALDGRTGETLWETPATSGLGGTVATDGLHIMVPTTSSSGVADDGRLVAYDFESGAEVDRIPYPDGVTDVQMLRGMLLGWSNATEEISVLE